MFLTQTESTFILKVLETIESVDAFDDVVWRTGDEDAACVFSVECSDTFTLATQESEDITKQNLALFKQAYQDVEAAGEVGICWGALLFCVRSRKKSPHPKYLTTVRIPDKVRKLIQESLPRLEKKGPIKHEPIQSY